MRNIYGAVQRRLSRSERTPNGSCEVQQCDAGKQDQESRDSAQLAGVLGPGDPLRVRSRVVRGVASAEEPAEKQEHAESHAG